MKGRGEIGEELVAFVLVETDSELLVVVGLRYLSKLLPKHFILRVLGIV